MGLVRFGAGIVQISGSIAGTTHARNRYGNYIRPRTVPVNPNSIRQSAARLNIVYLSEQWREAPLTPTQRAAWATYAAAVAWTNALGESIKLSGFNHYVRSNAARIHAGLARVDEAPTTLSLPPGPSVFSVNAYASTQKLYVGFDDADLWAIEVGGALKVEVGQPQNSGRNFFGGPFRATGAVLGAVSPPTSPAQLTSAFTLVATQQIWVRARVLRADGRCSSMVMSGPITVQVAPP
jgi:hypothetical protein